MKAFDVLSESKDLLVEQHFKQANKLVESVCKDLDKDQKRIVEGIYKEFRPLIEASLQPDQIQKIFTDVEAGATAAGGNRTMLGKGKDAVNKANEIVNNIGKWLQNTKPVQAFDQKFEKLKNDINKKFPDSKVLDAISQMGIWAKENPGKTAAIIGVLTALASLAGGPVGGAIAGQVLRGANELLKGEKLSTAIGKGLKTAAMGYLAGKSFELIGDAVAKGAELAKSSIPGAQKLNMMMDSTGLGFNSIQVTGRPEDLKPIKDAWIDAGKAWNQGDLEQAAKLIVQAKEQAAALAQPEYIAQLTQDAETRKAIMASAKQAIAIIDGAGAAAQGAVSGATAFDKSGKPVKKESVELSSRQVATIIEWCDGTPSTILNEGPMDFVKNVGKNLTTKVTADKLNKAWKRAGSPTDSNALAKVLRDVGVSDEVLAPIYKSMKLKLPAAGQELPAAKAAVAQKAVAGQSAKMDYKALQAAVSQLRTRDAQSLLKFIDTIDKPAPAQSPSTKFWAAGKHDDGDPLRPGDKFDQETGEPIPQEYRIPKPGQAPAAPAAPAPTKTNNVKVAGKRVPAKPKVAVAV